MRSPALAIGWELGQRLRLGLGALAAYAVVLGTILLIRFAMGRPVRLEASGDAAAFVVVPVATTFMFFVGVFSFGFAADLSARESIYPSRMFTLPLSTRALVGWPMFYGAAAMMVLFLSAGLFLRGEPVGGDVRFRLEPWGVLVPLYWPTLLAMVFLCWTQALTWMPYGLRGIRLIVAVLWLITLDAAIFAAFEYQVPESWLIAVLAPQLPLAYFTACFAVTRARHGDTPDWGGVVTGLTRSARLFPHRAPTPFRSASRAQIWFEWRLHGWSLPVWVGTLLPFELALLFIARNEPEAMTLYVVLAVLLTPPLMAGFVAAAISRTGPSGRDLYGLSTFIATQPLSSAAIVAAKLKVALLSTLVTWLLVLIALPLGLAVSGTLDVVAERISEGAIFFGTARVVMLAFLGLMTLMTATWKRLVHSLFLDLSGRPWLIKASVLVTLSFLVVIWPVGGWIHDNEGVLAALLNALPLVLVALACLKTSIAAWIAARLHDEELLNRSTLVTGCACWFVAVMTLYGALAWFWNTPHVAPYFLLLVSILEIPLARLMAAPLALAWNRHR